MKRWLFLLVASCNPGMPEPAACPAHIDSGTALPDAGGTAASLVMVGLDIGFACSGTIVHLDDEWAYVLSARHCFTGPDGKLFLPPRRARVYLAREDVDGAYWEPREAQSLITGQGRFEQGVSWQDFEFVAADWAILQVRRDPSMQQVPLADAPPKPGEKVALVTLRPQGDFGRPCPHVRAFEWGSKSSIALAGYSGAAIVRDGRVHGVFSGVNTGGVWFLRHISALRIVPVANVARPWAAASGL